MANINDELFGTVSWKFFAFLGDVPESIHNWSQVN